MKITLLFAPAIVMFALFGQQITWREVRETLENIIGAWVAITLIVNLVIDKIFCVPYDTSESFMEYVRQNPRKAGIVKFFRGGGFDSIKTIMGVIISIGGRKQVHESDMK